MNYFGNILIENTLFICTQFTILTNSILLSQNINDWSHDNYPRNISSIFYEIFYLKNNVFKWELIFIKLVALIFMCILRDDLIWKPRHLFESLKPASFYNHSFGFLIIHQVAKRNYQKHYDGINEIYVAQSQ